MQDIVEAALERSNEAEESVDVDPDEFRDPRVALIGCGAAGARRVDPRERPSSSLLNSVPIETTEVVADPDDATTLTDRLSPRFESGDLLVVTGALPRSETVLTAAVEAAAGTGALVIVVVTMADDGGAADGELPDEIVSAADLTTPLVSSRTAKRSDDLSTEEAARSLIAGLVDAVAGRSLVSIDYAALRSILSAGGIGVPYVGTVPAAEGSESAVIELAEQPLYGSRPANSVGVFCTLIAGPELTLRGAEKRSATLFDAIGERTSQPDFPIERPTWTALIDERFADEYRIVGLLTGADSDDGDGP